jgi:hypothetical protein
MDVKWYAGAPRFRSFEYIVKTRGSKEYMSKIIGSEGFWSTIMIKKNYEN